MDEYSVASVLLRDVMTLATSTSIAGHRKRFLPTKRCRGNQQTDFAGIVTVLFLHWTLAC